MEGAHPRAEGSSILSDDLLALVFTHLGDSEDRHTAGLTCRAWLRVASTLVVRSLHVLRPGVLPALPARFPTLTALDLSAARAVPEDAVKAIAAAYQGSLVSLSVANNKGLAVSALRAISNCRSLTLLDLSNCHHDARPITDEAIAPLAACRMLQTLRLAGCRAVTDTGLGALVPALGALRELSLRWCSGLTDVALGGVARHLVGLQRLDLAYCAVGDTGLAAVGRLPALAELVLACCSCISDAGLCRLAQGSPALHKLDLSGCKGISERGVTCFVGRCLGLRELVVAHDAQLLPRALHAYHHLQHLQVLNVSACPVSEEGLLLLGAGCKHLTTVTLWRCPGVTDRGVAALALGCRLLTALDLTCCRDVSGASLLALADFCPHLQVLRLEGCPAVTPAALLALAQRCPGLRHLDLTDTALDDTAAPALAAAANLQVLRLGFSALTNAGLLILAAEYARRGGSVLEELDLYRCSALEDAALAALLPHCPRLRKANFSYCLRLSDATLAALAGCPLLDNLEMRGWAGVTTAGLAQLASGCPRLAELDCKHVALQPDALAALVAHCPTLRQIHMSGCPASDATLAPLAQCHTLQTIKMVQCRFLTSQCLKPFLAGCESLRKIKLDARLRACVPHQDVAALEARLCYIKWMQKGEDK
ncbi:RNI-like domain containing protein [Klebsormidium nitens]|uniref:RNI-like domain containing protein n=1 Tax=Klebsormidium nitens TaxID=105231 RepID=A0A1Y1HQT7_KLENI|nr:RNI-like domain containing protein [Klebsormidium nitens]|eukprot:GAQ79351.1 RNI-like domain containing protein [Klebsormidium nitens]